MKTGGINERKRMKFIDVEQWFEHGSKVTTIWYKISSHILKSYDNVIIKIFACNVWLFYS